VQSSFGPQLTRTLTQGAWALLLAAAAALPDHGVRPLGPGAEGIDLVGMFTCRRGARHRCAKN
jgi:hypothetical protein